MRNSTFKRFKRKTHNFFFDHIKLGVALDYIYSLIVSAISAFIFGFGFCCFATASSDSSITIITGGASGVSQVVYMIFLIFGVNVPGNIIQSVFFFAVNIPLIIFAFKCIGKRFAILTLVNVALTSVFMSLLEATPFIQDIARSELISNSILSRALFAGVCTGLSSAIAFKGYFSCGGIDILTYYISLKKSANTGKYTGITNVTIIILYTVMHLINNAIHPEYGDLIQPIIGVLYAAVYLVIVVLVIDLINVRNKKVQVQIITTQQHMRDILIANFPHSVTIINAKGGYSGKDRFVMQMVVSSSEVKKVVRVVKASDKNVFIQISNLQQVYGNFFINPIK